MPTCLSRVTSVGTKDLCWLTGWWCYDVEGTAAGAWDCWSYCILSQEAESYECWSSEWALLWFPSYSVPDLSLRDAAFHSQGGSFLLSYPENTLIDTLRDVCCVALNPSTFTVKVNYQRSRLCLETQELSQLWSCGCLLSKTPPEDKERKSLGNCTGAHHCLGMEETHRTSVHNLLVQTSCVTWPNGKGARSGLFLFCERNSVQKT